MNALTKFAIGAAAVAALAAATPAQARDYHHRGHSYHGHYYGHHYHGGSYGYWGPTVTAPIEYDSPYYGYGPGIYDVRPAYGWSFGFGGQRYGHWWHR